MVSQESIANIEKIRSRIDKQDINYYIEFIVNSLFAANKYFNDQEPWNKKNDKKRLNAIIYTSLELIRKISPSLSTAYESAMLIFPNLTDFISDPFKTIPASNNSLKK